MTISKYISVFFILASINCHAQDNAILLKRLDSLPSIRFPYHSEFYNRDFPKISLALFSSKKLTEIPFKKIRTVIGAGGIDDREDSTFNLVNQNYEAAWNLIAKRPRFFVVEVQDNGVFLVSLSYTLKPIDAIRIAMADPAGNKHWYANRYSYISKELKITMHHLYAMNGGPEEDYKIEEKATSKEKWIISKTGYFKKINSR